MTKTITINAYKARGALNLYYINKDPDNVAPYARYITNFYDLDSVNWKHLKYVHVVGDYGDNSINLQWTKTPDYSTWADLGSKSQSSTYGDFPVWRNLGHARRVAFMMDWSGNSNIVHENIEVTYNIKTQ